MVASRHSRSSRPRPVTERGRPMSNVQPQKETSMSIIAKSPEQTTDVFVHYFNEGNLDRLIAAYYADGGVLAAAPGKAAGGDELRSALRAYLDTRGKITATTRHVLAAGDTALLVIDWVIQGVDPGGKPFAMFG